MLEIDTVSWRNFLSYGDYTTSLKLSGLGPCLITGEVLEDEKEAYGNTTLDRKKKSNGAGKSTITSVIQWVLFGRTTHSVNAGDNIINWFIGKDCWAQVNFKNGDSIRRTRNTEGKNELIVIRDGNESKLISDTMSTAKNQQASLAKTFGLDWDLFCGSAFFSQYSKPWLDMADQARRKGMERLLHIDRFVYRAKVAKSKCEKLDSLASRDTTQRAALEREIQRLEGEIARLEVSSQNFENKRQERHDTALNDAATAEQQRDAIQLPDLEKLKQKWAVVKQVKEKIDQQRTQVDKIRDKANNLNDKISKHESTANALDSRIQAWRARQGKVCTSCEQPIEEAHVGNKIEPLIAQAAEERTMAAAVRAQQAELRTEQKEAAAAVAKMEQVLAQKQPQMTIQDAKSIHQTWKQHDAEAKRLRTIATETLAEANPYLESIATAKDQIETTKASIQELNKSIERNNLLNQHYNYVYRAYNDRTKVKSLAFQDHVPFINRRLRHYLDVFGLDVKVELTDSLGITSNLWGYEYESGGERIRSNVAFMLATFDFHERMYGRQCNILVLDEVDARLDEDGIDSLINIIKNDLASKVETILVISHRSHMHDTFPREIKVTRKNRFSSLQLI